MSNAASSEAARLLSLARWGSTRPQRLAEELAERASEIPPDERRRLLEALQKREVTNCERLSERVRRV